LLDISFFRFRRQPCSDKSKRQAFASVVRQAFTTLARQAFVERLFTKNKTVLSVLSHRLVVAKWLEKGL